MFIIIIIMYMNIAFAGFGISDSDVTIFWKKSGKQKSIVTNVKHNFCFRLKSKLASFQHSY